MNPFPVPVQAMRIICFHCLQLVFSLVVCFPAKAQLDTMAAHYAKVITIHDLERDLRVLASDEYEGRDTGKEGQKKAAAYIRQHFIDCGIPPVPSQDLAEIEEGYYQPFELVEERSGSIGMVSASGELTFMQELLYFNEVLAEDMSVKEVIHVGDGSSIRDAKGLKNKVVLISESGSGNVMLMLGGLRAKSEAASRAGAKVLLVSTPRMPELIEQFGHYVQGSRMQLAIDVPRTPADPGLQTILVDASSMDRILGRNTLASLAKRKPGRKVPASFVLRRTASQARVMSENVLAYIEGSDKKEEVIVITAHYDHIGIEDGEVYNGADDDGSGTVAIMAIAKAFATAKANGHGPRRSVLVMPVSGEEKGLLGSKYYSERPVFPLENTVANLNIDMIGRVDSAHAVSPPYIYVIGSDRLSSELHKINEEANAQGPLLDMDYTFNARNDPNRFYYRSDHYNFARKGVPAIFYFSGVHEDYHQPGDTVDKILFDLLHKRALLTYHTAWLLANREDRILVDGKVE